jgi:multidrug resistance efflux pump
VTIPGISKRQMMHTSHRIALRQCAIAQEVPGHITAVLVTDNEHVNAGDVSLARRSHLSRSTCSGCSV